MPAIWTTQAKKTKVRVATASERLEAISYSRVHGSIGASVALVVDSEELLEIVFDDFLESVRRGARSIAGTVRVSTGVERRHCLSLEEEWRRDREEGIEERS